MATIEETIEKAVQAAVKRANAYTDSKIPKVNYKHVKGQKVTLDSSTSSVEYTISMTTTGNPVFLLICGDSNPETTKVWIYASILRGSTVLATQYNESGVKSQNIPFSLAVIDSPSAGTYTYKARINLGNTAYSTTLGENNTNVPQFMAFEIH